METRIYNALILLLMLTFEAAAFESSNILESWRMGDDYVMFVNLKSRGIRVSKGCEKENLRCEVWKILKSVSMKVLTPQDLKGGKNPGASLCHKQKDTQVIFARNTKGKQATFCLFPDGSMVDSGGLLIAAIKNDGKEGKKK